eukprot:595728-Rhodomonas_salina.2
MLFAACCHFLAVLRPIFAPVLKFGMIWAALLLSEAGVDRCTCGQVTYRPPYAYPSSFAGTNPGVLRGSFVRAIQYCEGNPVLRGSQVWVWGSNEFGQLGLGDELPRLQPTLVTALSGIGVHITAVAVGTYHVIALSSKGNVYVWYKSPLPAQALSGTEAVVRAYQGL